MSTRRSRATGESLDQDALRPSDRAALSRIRTLSHVLDNAFRIPGTSIRVGLDPVVGLLPGVGDSVASLASLYIVYEGYRADVSRGTLAKMLALLGVDLVIGSVPILGSVFDAFWKANTWNTNMLESQFERRADAPPTPGER